jgi:hypothetical protein
MELALPRATGAAEDYLLTRATAAIKPDLLAAVPPPNPADPPTVRLRNAARSFRVLKAVWRDDLGHNCEAFPAWVEFEKWRQLRHVLVHRLGAWQPGLDPQPSLADRLVALGHDPDLYRGLVPLASADLAAAIDNAIDLVFEAERVF